MKLLEYEAKALLSLSKIPVPASQIIDSSSTVITVPLPFVLKSQVPIGGRGKAGGIMIINTPPEAQPALDKLFHFPIKGFTPKTLLVEEAIHIDREFYISLFVDRSSQSIQLMAHKNGGIEVEENTEAGYLRITLAESTDTHAINFDAIGQQLANHFDLQSHAFSLQDLVQNLYTCFVTNDALLLEINPIILTVEGLLIAGDCKMTLDDAAAFRHEWKFEEEPIESNFVTLDPDGTVATIANGAGLAMATVDAVNDHGLKAANFLDIGGGANTQTLLLAFRRLAQYPKVEAIVINIFAGITKSDEVAKAIIAAKEQIETLPPLFIRIAGTNYEEAAALLSAANIPLLSSLEDALVAVKRGSHHE